VPSALAFFPTISTVNTIPIQQHRMLTHVEGMLTHVDPAASDVDPSGQRETFQVGNPRRDAVVEDHLWFSPTRYSTKTQ